MNLIEPHKESEEFLRLSVELKNKLSKWDLEVQNQKNKKYIRDYDDFKNGNIFKWQTTGAPSLPVLEIIPNHEIPNHGIIESPLLSQGRNSTYGYDYIEQGPYTQRGTQAHRGNNQRGKPGKGRRGGPHTPLTSNSQYQQQYE